ncbi:hypothetical protein GUJ93_ZPchr0007g6378 [Zizania palustris]|uniref:Xylanase inhibitor C-terminal domain-containing protein n=1 Tax=Zizania palustris TaxID=103762 RepID=A0A8J5TDF1_ZIZPA|nr:hypothetical protein GUJ93_ZPchr0007g6378 [Zizania palustris]
MDAMKLDGLQLRQQPLDPHCRMYASLSLPGITVNGEAILLPGALDHDGGVTLNTATPYTILQHDVYHPFAAAFTKVTARLPRMPR